MTSPTTVVTGLRANWGVSNCGQLMGTDKEAGLASIEPEGVYEHLAVGMLEEGYTLVYKTAPGGPDWPAAPMGRAASPTWSVWVATCLLRCVVSRQWPSHRPHTHVYLTFAQSRVEEHHALAGGSA